MDEERGTQREIAKTYRDRVQSRFTRSVWRSARFLLTLVLFAGGVVAIYYCEKESRRNFSTPVRFRVRTRICKAPSLCVHSRKVS